MFYSGFKLNKMNENIFWLIYLHAAPCEVNGKCSKTHITYNSIYLLGIIIYWFEFVSLTFKVHEL